MYKKSGFTFMLTTVGLYYASNCIAGVITTYIQPIEEARIV